MKFDELLETVGDAPLFETGLLLAGDVTPSNVHRQLSRWTASGKLVQLRRGLYMLAPPYQKVCPHPFLVANRLVTPSYVSLQAALAHYGLIPEYVPVVTSVTTGRSQEFETPLGRYIYHHVKTDHFHGYALRDLGGNQQAFIARPEKAILDQAYLQPGGETQAYLDALRLQNLERLDEDTLQALAAGANQPKLARAADNLMTLIAEEAESGYETLPKDPGQ